MLRKIGNILIDRGKKLKVIRAIYLENRGKKGRLVTLVKSIPCLLIVGIILTRQIEKSGSASWQFTL